MLDSVLIAWRRSWLARREWALRLLASLFGFLLAFCTAEIALRLPWLPLPMGLRNQLFGCYFLHDTYQSVRYEEPRLGVPLYKPDFTTTCFFNGYRWKHTGDRWGFRNPESWDRVEVVLLGDSFTYGHGVEEDQTIAHYLRNKLGVRVANLGITAGCPVHYVAYLRNFALRLDPKIVITLFFANDLDDMTVIRSIDELRSYVDGGSVPELGLYERESFNAAAPDPKRWTLERLGRWTLSYQTLRFSLPRAEAWVKAATARAFGLHGRPSDAVGDPDDGGFPDANVPGLSVASDYLRKAVRSMAASSRDSGARLVLAYIPMPRRLAQGRNELIMARLRDISNTEDLPLLDLTPVILASDGHPIPGTLLRGDGHLSPHGSEIVASAIASFLGERAIDFR